MGQHRTPFRNWNLVKPHILHILNLSFSKGFHESFVSKAQILSKSFKPFWSLDSERGHSYLSSLNDERLSGIRYRTSTIFLGVNSGYSFVFSSLWHFMIKCYFITKCVRFLITKCDSNYNMRRILKIASVHVFIRKMHLFNPWHMVGKQMIMICDFLIHSRRHNL